MGKSIRGNVSIGLLAAVACGGGGSADSDAPSVAVMQEQASALSDALDATLPQGALAEPQPFYRLELVERTDGTIDLVHLSLAVVDRFPQSAFAADYMLVSRDTAGVIRDVVPLLFEREGHSSSFEHGAFVHDELKLESPVTIAFLPAAPELSRIEVLDVAMNVQLSIDAGSLPSAEEPDDEPSEDPVPKAAGTSLKAQFDWLSVLRPGEDGRVPVEIRTTAKIVTMTSAASRQIAEGLAASTKSVREAVRTIAAVEWPEGSLERERDLLGRGVGPYLLLDIGQLARESVAVKEPELLQAITVHEASHDFVSLTNAAGAPSTPRASAWPSELIAGAARTVQRYRLTEGIEKVWSDLHNTGVAEGYAAAYSNTDEDPVAHENDWIALVGDQTAVLEGGFASAYGSRNAREDFATYVQTLQFPLSTDAPCRRFGGKLSAELSISYAKVILLRGVDAISDNAFQACVGSTYVDAPIGIEFDGRTFDDDFQAGVHDRDGVRSLDVIGSGPNTYRLLLHVALDGPDASPLGLHRLDAATYYNVGQIDQNQILLGNDNVFRARAGGAGFMLVTEYSNSSVSGAVFGVTLVNAAGAATDFWPFGTFSNR
ncbi:MAG: hypothetical protein ABI895_24340 [Deltaproteobacteria bacterium]